MPTFSEFDKDSTATELIGQGGSKDLSNQCNKCLKVLYTNADSLSNKMDELKPLVKQGMFNMVAITEALPKVSMYPIQEVELSLPGFNMISNFEHLQRYDGRGICLYVREDFSYVNIHQGIFREALLADVTLPNGDVVSVGVIYRSPNSSQENNLKLLKLISYFARVSKSNMIIMGDFNFPRISWSDLHAPLHSIEEKFVEVTLDSFMFQHVTEPTRCRDGQASNMLDLVFTKEEEMSTISALAPLWAIVTI